MGAQAKKALVENRELESKNYELTIVVPASFTEGEAHKVRDELQQLAKKYQAQVVSTEDWGKKRLAYKIKFNNSFQKEGYYFHVTVSMQPSNAQAFEKAIYLHDSIMRHLFVVAEVIKPSPTQETKSNTETGEASIA